MSKKHEEGQAEAAADAPRRRPGPRRPPPADAKKARNKAYEAELARLQVEIAHLQAWVKATGARIVIIFEGRDAAGKGGMIKRLTERVSPRVFRVVALPAPSDRQKTQLYMQRYIEQLPAAGEVRDLRPQLVQPPRRRAGHGLLHRARPATALPAGDPAPRGADHRVGHHAAQILPDRRRGGAGAPLPPAHRRSGPPVEALADGPRDPTAAGGTIPAPTTRCCA